MKGSVGIIVLLVTAAGATAADPPVDPPAEETVEHEVSRRRLQPEDVERRGWLDEHGLVYDLDVAIFYQQADQVLGGPKGLATISYQLSAEWAFTESRRSAIGTTIFGTIGLDYEEGSESLEAGTGSISGYNGTIYSDAVVVDELYWRQSFADGEITVRGGVVDLANWFDTNRVANDAYTQFFSASLENNLAIPFPTAGGFGAMVEWRARPDLVVRGGIADSNSDVSAPWTTARSDSIYGILELELRYEIPGLGRGTGRIIPWYATTQRSAGWGTAVNLDQELGSKDVGVFLRLGAGNRDVVSVTETASGGIAIRNLLLSRDRLAFGAAWSEPAPDNGFRDETLMELQYRIPITRWLDVTPNLQVVINPAQNPVRSTVWVAGVRVGFRF